MTLGNLIADVGKIKVINGNKILLRSLGMWMIYDYDLFPGEDDEQAGLILETPYEKEALAEFLKEQKP